MNLFLRLWHPDDADRMVEILNGWELISEKFPSIPQPYGQLDALTFINYNQALEDSGYTEGAYAIADIDTNVVYGNISLSPVSWDTQIGEVGYWIDPAHQNKGIASIALRLLIETKAFVGRHSFQRVQLMCDVENIASQRVAHRAGFRLEGILRSWFVVGGQRKDFCMFSRLVHEH